MTEGVFLRDVHSLEEMNNMIGFTGEVMANIEDNVIRYLDGVHNVLKEQIEVIKEQLEEAKERLSQAEDELSACEASQSYDEETGELEPSCSYEASAVEAARREVDELQEKYDAGQRIIDECQREIEDYNFPGSPLSPPGGHYLIQTFMCENDTRDATSQLREYIEDVYEYKGMDVGGDADGVVEITNSALKEDDLPMTEEEKLAEFQKNIQDVKDEQESESVFHGYKDANRVMRCPNCGRPLQLCRCQNVHYDVNLYKKQ